MNSGNDAPVTRAELAAAEDRILTAVARIVADAETRMQEFTRDNQSDLLRAFQKFAQRTEARWAAARLTAGLVQDALARIEDLERKLEKPDSPV